MSYVVELCEQQPLGTFQENMMSKPWYELREEQINVAVDWWCKAFAKQPRSQFADSKAPTSITGGLLASSQQPLSGDQLQLFADELRAALEREGALVMLSVDYGPSRDLKTILDRAGINLNRIPFPIKHAMTFIEGSVMVHGPQHRFEEHDVLVPKRT